MKLEEIIDKPQVSSIADFLAERSTLGVYIPAYQRPFTWGKDQFNRFLEDVAYDIKAASTSSHCGLFLGFIICYDDCDKTHVVPGEHNEQPLSVYNVVDGQQRISFISILSVLIHHLLGRHRDIVEANEWLRDQAEIIKTKLKKVISVDIPKRSGRPRLVRSLEDQWSTSGRNEIFESAIANFLSLYLDSGKVGVSEGKDEELSEFIEQVEELKTMLERFCQQTPPSDQDQEADYYLGEMEVLLKNKPLMKTIFSDGTEAAYEQGKLNFTGADSKKKKEVFAALLLGNYLYSCVHAVIVVTRRSYSRTLSIFDELNSTGVPLNAFDTFRPEVMKVNIATYHGSDRETYINKIASSVENKKKLEDTVKYFTELIISFALANHGEKLGRILSGQRNYLRRAFDPHINNEEEYLRHLSFFSTVNDMKQIFERKDSGGLSDFLQEHMSKKGFDKMHKDKKFGKDIDEASFCLRFLSKARFIITIAPLSIYLHRVHTSDYSTTAVEEFCDATRKIAAFCALWRSSFATTHGIEGKIRSLMSGIENSDGKIFALAMQKAPFPASELDSIFRRLLMEQEIVTFESWDSKASQVQSYAAKEVARFLLLVGSNKTNVSKKGPGGLAIVPDLSVESLITRHGFDDPLIKTIEHIVPTNESAPKNKYSKEEKNQLWNLTLVPDDVNKILGNKEWPEKQIIYKCFSSENEKEWERSVKRAEKILGKQKLKKLKQTDYGYLPMTKYLAMLGNRRFSKKQGQKRSKAILTNCWKILACNWLGWPKQD